MENPTSRYSLMFNGKGARYFGIWSVNVLLTAITLGLYYPWAKTKIRQFIWNETELDGDPFVYHGTGKELFKGFLIVYGAFLVFVIMVTLFLTKAAIFIGLFYILLLFVITPLAIYGSWRYRVSKTSWRGIYFNFHGEFRSFLDLYIRYLLISIVTLGIGSAWMRVKLQKYLFENTQIGNYQFDFEGKAEELLGLNVVGYILTLLTAGIYGAWWFSRHFKFMMQNSSISDETHKHYLSSDLPGAKLFGVLITNALLVIFTLGLGFPWAMMRLRKLYTEHIDIPTSINLDNIQQLVTDTNDATGDSIADVLDIGLDF